MTPYALQFVRAEELAIFNKVRDVVTRLPDVDLGIDIVDKKPIILSCHILARAIAKNFPLKVNSGYFARSYEHSWLTTASGHIIDVYPVATLGGPILIDGSRRSPARLLYTPDNRFLRGIVTSTSFKQSVSIVSKLISRLAYGQATG